MKSKTSELALFGGTPAFAQPLHVGRPNLGNTDHFLERTRNIRELCKLLGVKHCIPMCNATVAMEITIRALELKGEVIVPSFTFIATAHALQWQEITPVFCDIDPATHNLDPACVEKLITPRTTGIVGVHVWGRPCATEALGEIAARRGLKLMFDAAHAFACSHNGRAIGNFGHAEVFSFHATKFFNTFEGGAVATNDDALAAKIRLMKNFGFHGLDNVIYIGTNGKMTEISAAMGLTSLESLDHFIAINRANYHAYQRELANVPGIRFIHYGENEKSNYHYIVLEIDGAKAGVSRDQLLAVLRAENVLARRYFFPGCHRMEPYRSFFPNAGLLLPETERLTQRVLSLPNGDSLGDDGVRGVCNLIRYVIDSGAEIRKRIVKPV
jgi:dTDP-4-amino-4,6-dideoxygalactose transaminase